MAQFRGIIKSGRSEASRLGHKTTGLNVLGNGWASGVEARLEYSGNEDIIIIYGTHGSNGMEHKKEIGTIQFDSNNELCFFPASTGTIKI